MGMESDRAEALYLYTVTGGLLFGLPLRRLVTILSGRAAGEALSRGTEEGEPPEISWNGESFPVFRLREPMGLPSCGEELHALLFHTEKQRFAVLSEQVLDTAELPPERRMGLPDVVRCPENAFLTGVAAVGPPYEFAYLVDVNQLPDAGLPRAQEKEEGP